MGVVHQQRNPMPVGSLRQRGNIAPSPQIVGAGHVHRRRLDLGQRALQLLRRHDAGAEGRPDLRPEPENVKIQQRGGIQKRLVDIPRRRDDRAFSRLQTGIPQGQRQHGADALGGPLRGIKGAGGAEESRRIGLASGNNPARLIERIRPGNLRDIQGLAAQKRYALMPRHMQPHGVGGGIRPDEICNRRGHASSAWAAFIITAHSIRLRNSSQP